MGDAAEMIINGIVDQHTGEFIDDELSRQGGPGFPRNAERVTGTKHKATLLQNFTSNSKELNGVAKYLAMQNVKGDDVAKALIRGYCEDHLDFQGTLKECAIKIQEDFGSFVTYVKTHKSNLK